MSYGVVVSRPPCQPTQPLLAATSTVNQLQRQKLLRRCPLEITLKYVLRRMSVLPLPRPVASSSLLREMLDNPLQFDPPITKAAYTSTAGTVEVTKGPASPPRSVFARQLNGHGQGHAEEDDTTSMPTTTGSSSDGDRSTSPPGALARLISGAKDRHSSLPLTSSKNASSSKSAPQGDVSSAPPTPSRKGKAKEVDTGNTSSNVSEGFSHFLQMTRERT